MNFPDFIDSHREQIEADWRDFARQHIDAAKNIPEETVRDHLTDILDRLTERLRTPQPPGEQRRKSSAVQPQSIGKTVAAQRHGAQRMDLGFALADVAAEFRALRASILRRWQEHLRHNEAAIGADEFADLVRFNEAIDETLIASIKKFQWKVDDSRDWFLGVLGHDLRDPLGTLHNGAQILALSDALGSQEKSVADSMQNSIHRMEEMVNDLLELARLRLGSAFEIKREPVELTSVCRRLIEQFKINYPHARIELRQDGRIEGHWDIARLEQLIVNLATNALVHGDSSQPVTLTLSKNEGAALIEVHNAGKPISDEKRAQLLKSQADSAAEGGSTPQGLGLGLLIVKEIAAAHGGDVDFSSSATRGTVFRVSLPFDGTPGAE